MYSCDKQDLTCKYRDESNGHCCLFGGCVKDDIIKYKYFVSYSEFYESNQFDFNILNKIIILERHIYEDIQTVERSLAGHSRFTAKIINWIEIKE